MSEPGAERSFRRRGLGRGLDALLSADREAAGEDAVLISVAPAAVSPNPEQPRRTFDHADLQALADSIASHGLLHPIVVLRSGDGYELVAGERRLRAAQLAGVTSIPAVVRAPLESPRESLELALTENLLRSDLNAIEEANAYARLVRGFGLTQEAVAARLGRSRTAVTNSIRLLGLPASLQQAVVEGRISAGHARALLALDTTERQERLAARIEAEGLSVREVERLAQTEAIVNVSPARRPPLKSHERPDDQALQRGFERALGLPVDLRRSGSGKGRLVIHFDGDEELDGLYRKVGGPQL
ncbi:MAG: ParB/RepB/Spo0J family partition protein [Chloroflexi bacterium]|nr:ParB/RepB/Spo0J family partition protein [Chloroflexota bacterium]